MDAAESNLDAAVSSSAKLAAAAIERLHSESLQLQSALRAKDRALDSLRDTLDTVRLTLQSRVAHAESAAHASSGEAASLAAELAASQAREQAAQAEVVELRAHVSRLEDALAAARSGQSSAQRAFPVTLL